jgi:outer membrane murein-binding lipoprotein Lpp
LLETFVLMRILDFMTKRSLLLMLSAVVAFCSASPTTAQTAVQEKVDSLRSQLNDVQAKQDSLKEKLQLLEEQAKPENIEKSLAGIGSTHPEDLRESKRRQLETEKASVQRQLNLLTESRVKLEAALSRAEADSYHQSAAGNTQTVPSSAAVQATASSPNVKTRPRKARRSRPKARRVHE